MGPRCEPELGGCPEVALGEGAGHRVDDGVDPGAGLARPAVTCGKLADSRLREVVHCGDQEVVARGEVVQEPTAGDVGVLLDPHGGRAAVAVLEEHVDGGVKDASLDVDGAGLDCAGHAIHLSFSDPPVTTGAGGGYPLINQSGLTG